MVSQASIVSSAREQNKIAYHLPLCPQLLRCCKDTLKVFVDRSDGQYSFLNCRSGVISNRGYVNPDKLVPILILDRATYVNRDDRETN